MPAMPKVAKAEPKQGLGVKIPEKLYTRLRRYLADQPPKVKQAQVIAEALDEYLKRRGA